MDGNGSWNKLFASNLTLTNVVFECLFCCFTHSKYNNLTLTNVVFEFLLVYINLFKLDNLTLTNVVFELCQNN